MLKVCRIQLVYELNDTRFIGDCTINNINCSFPFYEFIYLFIFYKGLHFFYFFFTFLEYFSSVNTKQSSISDEHHKGTVN